MEPFRYTNRLGRTFYVCKVPARGGDARFVMASAPVGEPLACVPAGWEVAEAVNGAVTMRRVGRLRVTADEVERVRAALLATPSLRAYAVDARGQEIVVHEPRAIGLGTGDGRAAETGVASATLHRSVALGRYDPVLRFVLSDAQARSFTPQRRLRRGSADGWLALPDRAPLGDILARYLPWLGQESFSEGIGDPPRPPG